MKPLVKGREDASSAAAHGKVLAYASLPVPNATVIPYLRRNAFMKSKRPLVMLLSRGLEGRLNSVTAYK